MDSDRRSVPPSGRDQIFNSPLQPQICNDFRTIHGITGGIKRFHTAAQSRDSADYSRFKAATVESPSPKRQPAMDRTFQRTGLSVGLVAGTEKNEPFGHTFYRSPIRDTKYRINFGHSVNVEKNKNFTDRMKEKQTVLPGYKYV